MYTNVGLHAWLQCVARAGQVQKPKAPPHSSVRSYLSENNLMFENPLAHAQRSMKRRPAAVKAASAIESAIGVDGGDDSSEDSDASPSEGADASSSEASDAPSPTPAVKPIRAAKRARKGNTAPNKSPQRPHVVSRFFSKGPAAGTQPPPPSTPAEPPSDTAVQPSAGVKCPVLHATSSVRHLCEHGCYLEAYAPNRRFQKQRVRHVSE